MTQQPDVVPHTDTDIARTERHAALGHVDRGSSRPPLPVTRKLEVPDIIKVDVDERMDSAAAIEAAGTSGEGMLSRTIRFAMVFASAGVAWWLLPMEAPPRPPITLPESLQREEDPITPEERGLENHAVEELRSVGPHAAETPLRERIESGHASHRAWRTYLAVLERLGRTEEMLERAKEYSDRHPDRLESAHFRAAALMLQPLESQRPGGFMTTGVKREFKLELESAESQIERALVVLGEHEKDWSSSVRQEWRDVLLLDSARLFRCRWLCEDAPFEHEYRDKALERLALLQREDALNAIALRLQIYRRIREMWSFWRPKTTDIQSTPHRKEDLDRLIKVDAEKQLKGEQGEMR